MVHESMNDADHREARAGGVGDRGVATIGVPAENAFIGEAQAAQGVGARGELHARWRHLEDVGAADGIEHIGPIKEVCERLAVFAVAEEAEAGGRRNLAREAAHMAATAPKREV